MKLLAIASIMTAMDLLTTFADMTSQMAYNATIMPIRVLADFKTFQELDAAVAEGIRYAVQNGALFLQMSLGNSPGDPPLPMTEEALRFARSPLEMKKISARLCPTIRLLELRKI